MVCYDSLGDRYYCRVGYTCCAERSCCSTGHDSLYQTNWFWVVWAFVIGFICCCSYVRQRRRNGGRLMPLVFYNPQSRSGHESEEELLQPSTDGVFFIPPDGGDQTAWAQAEWYKANKPPPYSLVAPEPVEAAPPVAQPVISTSSPTPTTAQSVATTQDTSTAVSSSSSSSPSPSVSSSGHSHPILPPPPSFPSQVPNIAALPVNEPPPEYSEH